MTLRRISILIALGASLVFSLLYLTSFFNLAEDRVYDIFLRLRPERERFDKIMFLDVDDQAIAHVGVFPWPRSVVANGLLRLKEYGALNAVFDIEYIDNSPSQVDEIYLNQGLETDFIKTFSEIENNVADFLNAVAAGQLKAPEVRSFGGDLLRIIGESQDSLYNETKGIIRNSDEYLAQASALFGHTWATLNAQTVSLEGEQAERRPLAEKKFAYPIKASPKASEGNYVDVLPPIPSFTEAARGAGFTNVVIDKDGIRRRIFLTRKIQDHWYLQLAFAPLVEYLGNPELELKPGQLTLKGAALPSGDSTVVKDIVIPLTAEGAMMLDWPFTNYFESYEHISFALFSYLEEYQNFMVELLSGLAYSGGDLFPEAVHECRKALEFFTAAEQAKKNALAECSEEAFREYLNLRNRGIEKIQDFLKDGILNAVTERGRELAGEYPDQRDFILEETDYVKTILEYLETNSANYLILENGIKERIKGKICILGRVDTGTTDIGSNPFYGEYVNVGTHGVVIDMILSESFIILLNSLWSAALSFLLVPFIITGINRFKPGTRIVLGFCGVLLIMGISWGIFFFRGIFLGPLGPVLAMIAAIIIRETVAFISSEQEKQFIRKAFSTYLSGDVVEEIISDPSRLQLGGAKRHMTAIFTDIQGFSTISERLDPEDLVRLLNNYLSAMSNVILEQKGTIDKYEGDAIISFFGAPMDIPDHALRACKSAIIMKRIEEELNKTYAENGLSPTSLLTRIGINTGSMVVGNMGTDKKMDYTIMGNAVNLAARLEGVNKQYGTWILTSENTVKETEGQILYRKLDRVRVVGINEPVRLCELLDMDAEASPEAREKVKLFHEALDIFEAQDWTAAGAAFEKVLNHNPKDRPSKIYRERCAEYRKTLPAPNWDGVYNLSQK